MVVDRLRAAARLWAEVFRRRHPCRQNIDTILALQCHLSDAHFGQTADLSALRALALNEITAIIVK